MEGHAHEALTGIAAVALAALVCGMVLERLRQPAIVGYILAGVLLGPSALGLVEEREGNDSLAELGVLMLLFLIGMELSLRAFRRVWMLALVTTLIQIGAGVGVMLLCARWLGWAVPAAVVFGFVVALSSTAVAVKILESMGELRTRTGRIAVGVLIAQDLAVVPMMIGINAMGGGVFDWLVVPKILFSVAFLVGLILYLSSGRKVHLPFARIVAGHADLLPLSGLAFCFGLAAVSGLLGLSAAYGAFLAGLIIGNSTERHSMLSASQPIQSVLMMVFFLSVGLLIDLDYIWSDLTTVLGLFVVIAVFKTAVNVGALKVLGQDWATAFMAGLMISQVGEFSFLLAVIAADRAVITAADSRLIVAVTVMSLALSPLWVFTGRRIQLLVSYGVTEWRELMRLVYGPEVEMVTDALGDARSGARRQLRLGALWLRRRRQRRQRAKAAKAPQAT
ncbi:MAG: cation:proton antiporter, partial [Rhodospirillaceae bacterium]